MRSLLRLAPLVVLCAPAQAIAASKAVKLEKAKAEHQRLSEEMRKFASRNAWRGVEASYNKMLALEVDGVVLSYDDHMMGVQAAREFGLVTQVYTRLKAAHEVNATEETTSWLAEIDAIYRRVYLSTDPRYEGEVALKPKMVPFDPSQRDAIGAAAQVIVEDSEYRGLLPFGEYTFGDQSFTLTEDTAEEIRVYLIPARLAGTKTGRAPTETRSGLRIDLGPLYTSVGTTESAGVQATPFGGAGVRSGVGWELQLGQSLGVLAQTGYHGMLLGDANETSQPAASLDLSSQPVSDAHRDSLHMFYLWGAVSWWPTDDLSIAIGPSWAGGTAKTRGVVNDCMAGAGAECDQAGAAWGSKGSDEVAVNGTIMSGGGTIGVSYVLAELPGMRTIRGGLSLYGGAQSDLDRIYPWGQLAFTIIPST